MWFFQNRILDSLYLCIYRKICERSEPEEKFGFPKIFRLKNHQKLIKNIVSWSSKIPKIDGKLYLLCERSEPEEKFGVFLEFLD